MTALLRRPLLLLPLAGLLVTSCAHPHLQKKSSPALQRALTAWRELEDFGPVPKSVEAYRLAVAEVVTELVEETPPAAWTNGVQLPSGGELKIDAGTADHSTWRPDLFDTLEICPKPKAKGWPGAIRSGVGVPMTGVRSPESTGSDREMIYNTGQSLPVTAVLRFDAAGKGTLHLYDPREVQKVRAGEETLPLAADFECPTTAGLGKQSFVRNALGGLFRPGRFMDSAGLYAHEPYRRDKIPVILVHGLMSDPHIWKETVVSIMADPVLGKKYQCWFYIYPTGLPIARSSRILREGLTNAVKAVDPERDDANLHQLVLVGHSMGGLVSRMQIIDSGLAFWNTWFTRPPEQVPLDGQTGASMKRSLLFSANPDIKRVIYIAVPHRGADLADGWVGKLGSRLIRYPQQIVHIVTSVATLDVEMINPDRLSLRRLGARSIDNLSTTHPMIRALQDRPMKTPHHSIIGVRNTTGDPSDSSDGYVPYKSSHLDTALTEKLVPYGHCCTRSTESVAEVLRVLKQHAGLAKYPTEVLSHD